MQARPSVKVPQRLDATQKAIEDGYIKKSDTYKLDALGSVRNEFGENTCIGVSGFAPPCNIIGAGPGKPALNILAGGGILNTGNTFFWSDTEVVVVLAPLVNGSPARPVITSAVLESPGKLRIKGRVGGNKSGEVVHVDLVTSYPMEFQITKPSWHRSFLHLGGMNSALLSN